MIIKQIINKNKTAYKKTSLTNYKVYEEILY